MVFPRAVLSDLFSFYNSIIVIIKIESENAKIISVGSSQWAIPNTGMRNSADGGFLSNSIEKVKKN